MLVDLHPSFEVYPQRLQRYAENAGLYGAEVSALLSEWAGDFKDYDQLLDILHRSEQISRVMESGQQDSAKLRANFLKMPSWKDWPGLPLDDADCARVVERLMSGGIKPDDKVRIRLSAFNGAIGSNLLKRVMEQATHFVIIFPDSGFDRMTLHDATEEQAHMLGKFDFDRLDELTRDFTSIADEVVVPFEKPPEHIAKIYSDYHVAIRKNATSGKLFFSLTHPPTPSEAAAENIPYPDYVKLYVDMCDQPWSEISAAQLHLIDRLNQGKVIHFTNDDGTDLKMELVDENGKDFTFCNSVIARNLPGAEVFSAPRRNSVNGTTVANGTFAAPTNPTGVIKNLTLNFKDGYLESFTAEEGAEHFQAFLDLDPNNRYIGELGIGTNPHLKKHLCNILLTEKIGGSFHVALGDAYTNTDYLGTPVYVDNGNRSKQHWDITTMLYGNGGNITLDGERIMENGKFLDPKLDVLNRGWGALPVEQRPDRWKHDTTPFTQARHDEILAGVTEKTVSAPHFSL